MEQGRVSGNYSRFHAAIKAGLPPTQSPNLFPLGPARKFALNSPSRHETAGWPKTRNRPSTARTSRLVPPFLFPQLKPLTSFETREF